MVYRRKNETMNTLICILEPVGRGIAIFPQAKTLEEAKQIYYEAWGVYPQENDCRILKYFDIVTNDDINLMFY
jgi:hypothetical protein